MTTSAAKPSTQNIVVDIETIGLPEGTFDEVQQAYLNKSEDHGEPLTSRLALYGWTCQVIVAAFGNPDTGCGVALYLDPAGTCPSVPLPEGWSARQCKDEGELIHECWKILAMYKRVVTFNGRSFDLPVLMQRALVLGVPVTRNPIPYRFSLHEAVDMLDVFTCFGVARRFSFDFICRSLGIKSPKSDMCGKDVEKVYREEGPRRVVQYCAGDVDSGMGVLRRVEACGLLTRMGTSR